MMANTYDFIVVGAGPSGSVLASRLATAPRRPSVLLLEAGGPNAELGHMSGAERFQVAFQPNSPLNWGFTTTPQHQLRGQSIDYSRGKGLGGSTAINFCGWVTGPSADWDEWARMVAGEARNGCQPAADFTWANARRCLKRVERAHLEVPSGFEKWMRPKTEDHGTDGPVDISYGGRWHDTVQDFFVAVDQRGLPLNPDVNSGDPIGMGMGTVCIRNGTRVTAATAYLAEKPGNLTILPDSHVAKIVIDAETRTASGVRTVDGREFVARREVIVSCGAIGTPQLLLLSGVGPAEEMGKQGIEPMHELPAVGKNLQDHCYSTIGIIVKKGVEATESQSPTPMGWFKLDAVLKSAEFRALPEELKAFLRRPTVPTWEMATHTPPRFDKDLELAPDETYLGAFAIMMNPQSRGTVQLRSANPLDHPDIDPRFLAHPFDRRLLIEAVRELMKIFEAPALREKTIRQAGWPKDDSDESIWEHIRNNVGSSWHMCGTARMGRDEDSCVDSGFRVHGLQQLRVVDLSVCPLIPSNHTQSTAYILGEMAADVMIGDYCLDSDEKTPVSSV